MNESGLIKLRSFYTRSIFLLTSYGQAVFHGSPIIPKTISHRKISYSQEVPEDNDLLNMIDSLVITFLPNF